MARPTGPKPPELLQLQAPAAELFSTLGLHFEVAPEHRVDLRDVRVELATLFSTRELAALAMRYTQIVHQAAMPGVAIGSDVVIAMATDLNLLLGRLAREARGTSGCVVVIETTVKLLNEAAFAVVARYGLDPIDLV